MEEVVRLTGGGLASVERRAIVGPLGLHHLRQAVDHDIQERPYAKADERRDRDERGRELAEDLEELQARSPDPS
jgi:hypothetical protein